MSQSCSFPASRFRHNKPVSTESSIFFRLNNHWILLVLQLQLLPYFSNTGCITPDHMFPSSSTPSQSPPGDGPNNNRTATLWQGVIHALPNPLWCDPHCQPGSEWSSSQIPSKCQLSWITFSFKYHNLSSPDSRLQDSMYHAGSLLRGVYLIKTYGRKQVWAEGHVELHCRPNNYLSQPHRKIWS